MDEGRTTTYKIIILFAILSLFYLNTCFASGEIIYSRQTESYWQLWLMNTDGSNDHQITSTPKDKRTPTVSMDGKKICYRSGNGELFTIDINGNNEQRILTQFNQMMDPSFSPIEDKLAFARISPRVSDTSQVWIARPSGEEAQILSQKAKLNYHPVFSPDGKKILFIRSQGKGIHDLCLFDIKTRQESLLTDSQSFNSWASFSKDGKTILFASNRENKDYDIYTMNAEKKKITRLTHEKGLDIEPVYADNEKKIIFVSNRSGQQQIWSMTTEGKDIKQLTSENESIEPAIIP